MFRCYHHHQGAHNLSLLKLRLLKQSFNLHWCGVKITEGNFSTV